MEPEPYVPTGDLPHPPHSSLPENIDDNWTPLEKAVESYTRSALYCIDLWIHQYEYDEDEDEVENSETDIHDVVDTFREYLGVDPPAQYLKLLRITDGVCGAGSYDKELGRASRLLRLLTGPGSSIAWIRRITEKIRRQDLGFPRR